jgi:hypothetical protein
MAVEGREQMQQTFDRPAEDVGNSVHLEHVNVNIASQHQATLFYVAGLGLTRDPYLMVSDDNMWVNVGRSQFHLPSGPATVLRGHTGLVISGREALLQRLATERPKLADTKFDFSEHNDYVEAICPWGNRIHVHEPDAARFGRITLGMPYVEFDVPQGNAAGIVAFYRQMLEVPAELVDNGSAARVLVGNGQHLIFRETSRPLPDFEEHHVQIYVVDFSGPYERLKARNLVSCEDNRYQYRFRDIIDLETGRHLFKIEHEVRSVKHPNYLRPLINRNPAQMARTYSPGHDQWNWAMPPEPMDTRP